MHKQVYLVHFSLPMHANLGAKLCVFVHVQDVDIYIYVHVNNMYIVHCVKVRFAIMSLNCTKALAIQGIYTYYLPTCTRTHRYPSGWWNSPNWRTSWPESVCHAHSPGGLQPWVLPSVWPMRWMLSLDRRLGTQFGSRTVPAQELYSSKHNLTLESRCVCVYTWKCALVIRSCEHDKCMHD